MSHAAITLRPAVPSDAHAVALMSREYIEHGLGWRYDPPRVLRAIRRPDTTVLLACEREVPVGFGVMEFGDERAHLVLLAVRPTHRRRGIARRLLEWMIESALTAGIESVHLELRSGNEAAQRFYRALGFAETVVLPRYYGGREAALRMVRVLRTRQEPAYVWRPPAIDRS